MSKRADGAVSMDDLQRVLEDRFGRNVPVSPATGNRISAESLAILSSLAKHRSHRVFTNEPVPLDLLELLTAVALSSPSKSDLQQRDIIVIQSEAQLAAIKELISDQAWTGDIHTLLVFCGNNRRQRQLHEWRGHTFVNDHLDAFFNPAVDAGIALQAFVAAAEVVGLGCCPISGIRNRIFEVADLLSLPDYTYPVAGLAVGWPASQGALSARLSLDATVHTDRFRDNDIEAQVDTYDRRRIECQRFPTQRNCDRFGEVDPNAYFWSEDKARQYAEPERQDFAAFVRHKKFQLR